ncbi:MAG: PorV/PorQ family protein [Bacteroidetes bacterium]|nr:PorV/PorQ family protein [Bacteroidota bacterium]
MKKLFLLFLFLPLAAFSGGTVIGKYAGEFMSIGIGGRALGLGSAYAALANDVTAGYWNPAGLARITYPEFSLMHDERFGNLVNYDYAGFAVPYGSNILNSETGEKEYRASSFGFSVIRLGVDGIPDTRKALADSNGNGIMDGDERLDYNAITYFNASDYAIYFSYAKQHSENFFYGVNVKLIRRNLGDIHGNGIGFDLGALFLPAENISLAANLQDAATTLVAWSTGTNELISPTLKLGAAYFLELFGGRLTPALGADVRFENRKFSSVAHLGPISVDPQAGIEFDYKNLVAVRAGYNDIGNLTLGAGIHLRKLDIDYSFAKFNAADQLGNTHRISLRLRLEEEKYRRGSE